MLNIFKKSVPTNETKVVDAAKSWTVTWYSKNGEYSTNKEQENAVFLSIDDAEGFKKSLESAFKLLRYTYGTNVTIKENS